MRDIQRIIGHQADKPTVQDLIMGAYHTHLTADGPEAVLR
jgi:hypothetical protein